MNAHLNKSKKTSFVDKYSYLSDSMIQDFYVNFYESLSSKELDRQFNNDILSLVRSLKKLPNSERRAFSEVLSRFIEFYLNKKIEKEIDESLSKILNF